MNLFETDAALREGLAHTHDRFGNRVDEVVVNGLDRNGDPIDNNMVVLASPT
jgi:hypothetical protein